jgi:hypothetical protein
VSNNNKLEAEVELLAAIATAFGTSGFDTTSIVDTSTRDKRLCAALEAAVPGCRFSRSSWTIYRDGPIRRVLTRLARDHFTTDRMGWWYVKASNNQIEDCWR